MDDLIVRCDQGPVTRLAASHPTHEKALRHPGRAAREHRKGPTTVCQSDHAMIRHRNVPAEGLEQGFWFVTGELPWRAEARDELQTLLHERRLENGAARDVEEHLAPGRGERGDACEQGGDVLLTQIGEESLDQPE